MIGSCDPGGGSGALDMISKYEQMKAAFGCNSRLGSLCYGHTNNMAVHRDLFRLLGPFIERARGADTMFVRTAVDRFTCEVVAFPTGREAVERPEAEGMTRSRESAVRIDFRAGTHLSRCPPQTETLP